MKPRFKGDYSEQNWRQFNRFSLAFLILSYPVMMFAVIYFIITDGIFSYAGFVAIEVIAISTLMASLMLLDAISALRCRTDPKRLVKPLNSKLQAGLADYESDNEGKKILKKQNQLEDFGADENEPKELDSQTSFLRSMQHLKSNNLEKSGRNDSI